MQIKLKKQHGRYKKYKKTGLPWISEVPENWSTRKLKYCSNIQFSTVDKHIFDDERKVSVCNYTDVYYGEVISNDEDFRQGSCSPTEYKKYRLRKGDVIITKDSESPDDIAIPAYVAEDFENVVCGYHLALIRTLSKGLYGKFLFRFFQSDRTRKYFEINANGITRFGLGKAKIENLLVPVPPEKEQATIADYLDEKTALLNRTIEVKRKQIELLKERQASLINRAVTRGVEKNVEMKESGVEWVGQIPSHWEIRKTKFLFQLVAEPAPKNNDYELLSIYTDIGVRPRKTLEQKGNKASTTDGYWKVKKGDIIVNKLLAWMGAIGYSIYDGVTSPAYDILRPKKEIVSRFYHYTFRCGLYLMEFRRQSRGIMDMRLRLYFDRFGQIPLLLPPQNEQQKIVAFLDSETQKIDQTIALIEKSITLLEEYKTSLISHVVTGKINVMTS